MRTTATRRPAVPAPAPPRSEGIAAEQRRGVQVVEKTGPWGFFFLLAYIGAAIYFVGQSGGGFWAVILGLLQAMVWPVYLIFHALEAVGA